MIKERLDHIASGVIYDFAGWLTCRDKQITLSAVDAASPAAEAVKEFLTLRGVDQDCDPFFQWHMRCGEAVEPDGEPSAWADVRAERQRQIGAEGWTTKHDDRHSDGSMALAAACYASNAATWAEKGTDALRENYADLSPGLRWPWARKWWKPKSQRQDLVRAAALVLAEIERLDRAALKGKP